MGAKSRPAFIIGEMKPPEQIETARLQLRKPLIDDASALFTSYTQDPEVTHFLLWKPHRHVGETEAFLHRCLSVWAEERDYPFVACLKETGVPIGMTEIHGNGYRIELGYVFERSYWGKGIATEAVRALVHWALNEPEIYRVQAACDVDNIASGRVLEKAGMQREGTLRRYSVRPAFGDQPRDCHLYAIVK